MYESPGLSRLPDTLSEPSTLRRFLFRERGESMERAEVIRWWERRRLPYNLIVGSTGLFTMIYISVLGSVGPYAHASLPPLIAPVIVGTIANVLYTGGWISELLLRPLFGPRTSVVGAAIFRYGLVFSVGITLLPNVLATIEFGVRVTRWLFGG